MSLDLEKLEKAKAVLQKMAQGIDPVNGGSIAEQSFLHDPRIIRCLFYVAEALDLITDGTLQARNQKQPFAITAEEKARISLPEGPIGINLFAAAVNQALAPTSRKLTGLELNKHLKTLGILTDVATPDGKKHTAMAADAARFGIHTEQAEYNGNQYEKIVYDERGKQFLLTNLERILRDDTSLLA